MSQRRCYLCGRKIGRMPVREYLEYLSENGLRKGHKYKPCKLYKMSAREFYGDRLGKLDYNNKISQRHLFCGPMCGNWWMIDKGLADRWDGIHIKGGPKIVENSHSNRYVSDEEYERIEQRWSLV